MTHASASLPDLIRFGTSTWAYEGWRGLVYRQPYAKGRFARECLAEYTRYEYRGRPLFRAVGLDQTFYRPPLPGQLAAYAAQVPEGFDLCSKVWEEITIPRFADHPRYGIKAGKPNPRFLDATLFADLVLPPYAEELRGHTGPFIFEFQRTGIEPEAFLPRLDRFLGALPPGFAYAIEVRHAALLGPRYRDVLTAHGAAHVYNHWTWMPPLAEQHRRLGGTFTAPCTFCRLMTPLGTGHAEAVERAKPYDRIVQVLPEMRADVLGLVRQAAAEGRRAYVLVNNRSEGCAPLTIQALVDELLGAAA